MNNRTFREDVRREELDSTRSMHGEELALHGDFHGSFRSIRAGSDRKHVVVPTVPTPPLQPLPQHMAGLRRMRSSRKAGASLVELVVASAILSIALLGALTGQIASRKLLGHSAERGVALEVLRTEMNAALSFDSDAIAAGAGHHSVGQVEQDVTRLLEDSELEFTLVDFVEGAPLNLRYELRWEANDGVAQSMNLVCCKR